MSAFGLLQVALTAKTASFNQSMRQSATATERLQRNVRQLDQRMARAQRSFANFARAASAFTGLALSTSTIKSFLDATDQLAKMARTVGISVQELQALEHISERAGISTEQLNTALRGFAVRVGEARAGTGSLASSLGRINPLALKNIVNAKNQSEALGALANAISGAKDETDKLAIASAAFGTRNSELVRVFGEGAEVLQQTVDETNKKMGAFNTEQTATAERLNDIWADIKKKFKTTVGGAFLDFAAWVEGPMRRIWNGAMQLMNMMAAGLETVGTLMSAVAQGGDAVRWDNLKKRLTEINEKYSEQSRYMSEMILTGNTAADTVAKKVARLSGAMKEYADQVKAAIDALAPPPTTTQELEELDSKFESLKRSLDPAYRSMQEFNDSAELLNKLLAEGKITRDEYNQWLGTLKDRLFEASKEWKDFLDVAREVEEDIKRQNAQNAEAAARFEALKSRLASLKAEVDPLVANLQRWNEAQNTLNESVAAGLITQEEATQTMEKLRVQMDKTAADGAQASESLAHAVGGVLQSSVSSFADSLIEFATSGKFAFKDFANSVIQDIAKMVIQFQALQLIKGSSLGSFFGITGSAHGNAFNHGQILPFAHGGVISGPTMFGLAGNRMGIAGEAGPEAILPLRRGSDGDLGVKADVHVTVNNNAPGTVATATSDEAGNIEITVNQIARDILSGGGRVSRALETTYGVTRGRG
ncbi:phage tail tape measure C-terminal domain-containing protein [uncultured Microbulbifer sp.]|uniref:phage tail tape measure C-terminal domain-containing protein n=1 Tax=uncultured Microbulbifer sp. TaxID=348147 RepID=UPI0026210F7F|nr:phage tail tape measure C-terminal domain-containing protein [uncultured Microbulbifer sp.]